MASSTLPVLPSGFGCDWHRCPLFPTPARSLTAKAVAMTSLTTGALAVATELGTVHFYMDGALCLGWISSSEPRGAGWFQGLDVS